MDLIDRQAAIDVVNGIDSEFAKYIEELPSAQPTCTTCIHNGKAWDEEPCDGCTQNDSKYEPERKKGKWEPIGSDSWKGYRCLVCKSTVEEVTPYCPWCGADMKR